MLRRFFEEQIADAKDPWTPWRVESLEIQATSIVESQTHKVITHIYNHICIYIYTHDIFIIYLYSAVYFILGSKGKKNRASFFLRKQLACLPSQERGVMFSLHLKATMMKVSDPIMFGHCVKAYFKAPVTLWLCQNSYWTWPFIVDLPIKNSDFPQLC